MRLFLICLGGAVGTAARYFISTTWPFGTLIVNLAGSFLIAVIMELSLSNDIRLALTTGLMGGFTTYSAFNQETLDHFRSGAWTSGAGYIAATVIGCLVAGLAGVVAGRALRA